MIEPIHIVFCADRRVLPGLHVAAYSVVANHLDPNSLIHIHVFSNELTSADIGLLNKTLFNTRRPYLLEAHAVSQHQFSKFPSMSGSWGAYFRLLAPELLSVDRITYVDVDTVCYLDAREFLALDLGDHPAGFVAETTIAATPDCYLSNCLPNDGDKPYLNSGVMVVDRKRWLERQVTQKCMEFLRCGGNVSRHEQTALNYVLLDDWHLLDERFNYISNWRKNWTSLRDESLLKGKLVHFLDNPKPWDYLAEFIHPHYRLWRSVLDKTALNGFRSWHATPCRRFPKTKGGWNGYKKAFKDRLLFVGYTHGLLKTVKGMSSVRAVF